MRRSETAAVATIPARALDAFNWMRGLAAVAVLVGHIRILMFRHRFAEFSPSFKVFYFLTAFSHQAVIVFFVLSGFFIGTSVVVASRGGTWSWQTFALRRLTRLYVVFLPALFLTAAWDLAGRSLFGFGGVYGGRLPPLNLVDTRHSLTFAGFVGNALFLQPIVVLPFGSNAPLWTLGVEFWCYVLFALLFRAVFGNGNGVARIAGALGAGTIVVAGGPLLLLRFPVWMLGAVVAVLWVRHPTVFPRRPWAIPAAALGLASMLLVADFKMIRSHELEDLAVGVATALFIAALLGRGGASAALVDDAHPGPYRRWGDVLGGFSYTLYASQYPVLVFLEAWLLGGSRWATDGLHVVLGLLVTALVMVAYAYPVAQLTEARTEHVRRWLERQSARGPVTAGSEPQRPR